MNDADTYDYFLAALSHTVKKMGRGAITTIAIEAGVSQGYLSQILNKKKAKKAGFQAQLKIAKACGYSYEDFLMVGKKLLEKGQEAETADDPPETKQQKPQPPVGNVIRVYNNILERTGIELDAEGQEKLFNLIRRKLRENAEKEVQDEFVDIAKILDRKAK